MMYQMTLISITMSFILMIITVMISVAFLTLFERKVLSYMQLRKGPNKMSFKGLMQPFSDMMKLMSKEMLYINSNKMFYYSPIMMFMVSSALWINYPWIFVNISMSYSMILLLFIMSINVYPILVVSWVSKNNYSMLGMMRAMSQMISFEVIVYLIFFILMIMSESFSLIDVNNYQGKIMFSLLIYPSYVVFMVSMLIDLNRVPFDLIEGESELVSGFNIEYFSGLFTMIFLSEYMNLLFISTISVTMFFGIKVWTNTFVMLNLLTLTVLVMIRGVLARVRYDHLMYTCWMEMLVIMLYYMIYLYLVKEMNMMINM